ncbi:MAG: hypothetical protein QXS20_01450 [Candidatus Thorarchaeota archaeon]
MTEVGGRKPATNKIVIDSLAISSGLAGVDLVVALLLALSVPTVKALDVASVVMILEFGILLIVGSCMLGTAPLDDQTGTSQSESSPSDRNLERGKKLFAVALFLLLYALLTGMVGSILQ